jgi:hypothetical protein
MISVYTTYSKENKVPLFPKPIEHINDKDFPFRFKEICFNCKRRFQCFVKHQDCMEFGPVKKLKIEKGKPIGGDDAIFEGDTYVINKNMKIFASSNLFPLFLEKEASLHPQSRLIIHAIFIIE